MENMFSNYFLPQILLVMQDQTLILNIYATNSPFYFTVVDTGTRSASR